MLPYKSFIEIENSKFNFISTGIDIHGNVIETFKMINCTLTNSSEYLTVNPRRITDGEMRNLTLHNNQGGLQLQCFTGTFSMYDSSIRKIRNYGLSINLRCSGKRTIHFINSNIAYNGETAFGIFGGNVEAKINVRHSTFEYNRKGVFSLLSDSSSAKTSLLFASNVFVQNSGVTAQILSTRSRNIDWVFLRNTFESNKDDAVIVSGARSNCYASLRLIDNIFTNNTGEKRAVVYLKLHYGDMTASKNAFRFNTGTVILYEGRATNERNLLNDNVFEDNKNLAGEVVSFLRIDGELHMLNNTFARNKANNLILLQLLYRIEPTPEYKRIVFTNNTLVQNSMSKDYANSFIFSCILRLRGLLQYKIPEFYGNRFVNPDFDKEFCLTVDAQSQTDSLQMTHNWWGTTDSNVIRERVLDFDSNHDYAIAHTSPFLATANGYGTVFSSPQGNGRNGNKLGGRLFESLVLTEENSPYDVTSDLTILSDVVLKVEPNVEIRFSPGMSLLVVGTLIARGTREKNIKMTVAYPKESTNVRLQDGTFPWEGRLEMFYNNQWKPVCWEESDWSLANTEIICRELGYLPSDDLKLTKFSSEKKESWPFKLRCHGNESSLSECHMTDHSIMCNGTDFIGVKCKGEPWGNIRFVESNESRSLERSVLEHVQISHCGKHFMSNVPAIESVMRTPTINFISIQNCTSGGLRYFLPTSSINVSKTKIMNVSGDGFSIIKTDYGVTLKESVLDHNFHGVVFDDPRKPNLPSVHYGRLMICDVTRDITLSSRKVFLYFGLDVVDYNSASVSCRKDFYVPTGKVVRIRLIYFEGNQMFHITGRGNTIKTQKSHLSFNEVLFKDFLVADGAHLHWQGHITSKVMFEVDVVTKSGNSVI